MKMLDEYAFWSNVDDLLKAKGYTIKDLCSITGASYRTVTTQRTRQTYPKTEELFHMAEALGVSVDYLLTGNFIEAPYSARSLQIARACEDAGEEHLYVIETLLGIKKTAEHPLPEEKTG